jgi:hypothetical protein
MPVKWERSVYRANGRKEQRKMKVRRLLAGMFALMLCLSSLYLALADEEIENMARGGDFEEPTDREQWRLNLGNNGVGTMTVDDKEAAIGKCSLFIDGISFAADESWKPQIDQTNVQVLEDGEYTLSAFLKAEEPRPVGMYSEIPVDPWTKIPNKVVNVGTEWEEYWATGVPPAGIVTIGFKNEGSKISYWIDGVRFYSGEYIPTEIEGQRIAVSPGSKVATTWSSIRAQY